MNFDIALPLPALDAVIGSQMAEADEAAKALPRPMAFPHMRPDPDAGRMGDPAAR